ncbi:hypothetical protein QIG18_28220, partial [Klebsiella pneumoniae]|nr:hypothetical protein [Klebsiella pneumoniae]
PLFQSVIPSLNCLHRYVIRFTGERTSGIYADSNSWLCLDLLRSVLYRRRFPPNSFDPQRTISTTGKRH